MGNQKIQLSISILLSKDYEGIKRCLESLQPLREAISCQLILTDTSKEKKIHELAEKYADLLLEFEWCRDFSAARNLGLKAAEGEWFFFLDDDEWIEDPSPLIEFLKNEEKNYDCVNYIQRNWHDRHGEHYSDFWVSRMIRRRKETHFESKIHEYLTPAPGNCKGLRLIVNHTGYIYDTEEEKLAHFKRNESLLLEMLEDEPGNLRWKTQLAQEYWAVSRFDSLINICQKGILQVAGKTGDSLNRDLGTFYAGIVAGNYRKKDYQKGFDWIHKALSDDRTSIVCRAYVRIYAASMYFEKMEYKKARNEIESYLLEKEEALSLGTAYENMKCAMIAGEAFDEMTLKKAYSILILCGLKEQDYGPMEKFFSELHWENHNAYVMDGFLAELIDGMANSEEIHPSFLLAMEQIFRHGAIRQSALPMIIEYEEKNKSAFWKLQKILSAISSEHWYPSYCAVFVCDRENEELVGQAIKELVSKLPEIFEIPSEILSVGEKNGYSLGDIFQMVDPEKWKQDVEKKLYNLPESSLPIFERELMNCLPQGDSRLDYAILKIYEKVAMLISHFEDFTTKRGALLKYADIGCQYAFKYYEDDVVYQLRRLMPNEVALAVFLKEALICEEENPAEAQIYFKNIEEEFPGWAGRIKYYLSEKAEEERRQKREARIEMNRLQESIIKQAQELKEGGFYEEALETLKRLQAMRPDELDVIGAILEVRLAMLEAGAANE